MTDNIFRPESVTLSKTKYLVDGLFPLGNNALLAAQPGVGKSFWLEALAVEITCNEPFMGRQSMGGNVLLIDEDTPTDDLDERLARLFAGRTPKFNLYKHSQEGHTMETIPALIDRYKDLRLIIIECLVSICDGKDIDNTTSAGKIGNFINSIKKNDRVVITSHHITTHNNLSVGDIMTKPNPQGLVMNNTRIVSSCDTLFLAASHETGQDTDLETLYVRPVSRRKTIPMKAFSTKLVPEKNEIPSLKSFLHFEYGKEINWKELSKAEKRILSLFDDEEIMTVQKTFTKSGQFFSLDVLRPILSNLEEKGYIQLLDKKGAKGALLYSLAENSKK